MISLLEAMENLGNAVVERAVWDYRMAIERRDYATMRECEEFFCGDDFKIYSSLDGYELMDVLKHEPKETRVKLLNAHIRGLGLREG